MPDGKPPAALFNATTGKIIADRVVIASSPLAQLRGWIGRRNIGADEALGLPRCSCVHTFGMRFVIDVAYCDGEGRALRIIAGLRPQRISPRVKGAVWAWEMRAANVGDDAERWGLLGRVAVGDRLILRAIESSDARSSEVL